MNTIGTPQWTRDDLRGKLQEFSKLYAKRPVADNRYGMRSPQMFPVWFIAQRLRPTYVIESGVWKGQGTWFLEQAAPDAQVHSIDVDLSRREYISERVTYHCWDFFYIDWSSISKEDTLCFFDDHQDAMARVRFAQENGFKMLMFEDNYPPGQGDCDSLKKVFARGGKDADYLRSALRVYYEFPPVFQTRKTRWGDAWTDKAYPTPRALCKRVWAPYLQVYLDEAMHYTWMCYGELK